ncbi:hypothetical protein BX600DRAFT_442742 [Xylariales sp. PMI_506]|nr:hypothetical protein BX600DRAFT_442742 [Xylariales sp. PMI_506]
MRFSTAIQLACGAAAVSALSLPSRAARLRYRTQLVDLDNLGPGFEKITLDQAKSDAAANNAKLSSSSSSTSTPEVFAAAADDATSNDSTTTNAAASGTCTNPSVRVEWRSMSTADQSAFLSAVNCLIKLPASGAFSDQGSTNRYEDLVAVHYAMVGSVHMHPQFLPWHRYYVAVFEDMLRTECSFTGPLPWWNEPLDAGNFANSPIFTSSSFGTAALKTSSNQGTCVEDGAFAGLTIHVGGEQCLSRAVDEGDTAQCTTDFVNSCNSNSDYANMESCMEYGPHAYGHDGVGAIMSVVSYSPSDPVFFMHHGFVDHSWLLWQNADTASRLYAVDGCTDSSSPCTAPLTTDYVLSSMGLRDQVTVNDVMDTQGGYLCYVYDS